VIAVPIADDSLFGQNQKARIGSQELSLYGGIEILQIVLDDANNFDYILPQELNDEGRNPDVVGVEDL
jgi:hypothetical protein